MRLLTLIQLSEMAGPSLVLLGKSGMLVAGLANGLKDGFGLLSGQVTVQILGD